MSITIHKRLLQIAKREVMRIATKPMYLFCGIPLNTDIRLADENMEILPYLICIQKVM